MTKIVTENLQQYFSLDRKVFKVAPAPKYHKTVNTYTHTHTQTDTSNTVAVHRKVNDTFFHLTLKSFHKSRSTRKLNKNSVTQQSIQYENTSKSEKAHHQTEELKSKSNKNNAAWKTENMTDIQSSDFLIILNKLRVMHCNTLWANARLNSKGCSSKSIWCKQCR